MAFRAGHFPFATASDAPLDPLYEVADLVERAHRHLLDAAKIADAADMPAIHMQVTDTRERVQRCQAEITTWASEKGAGDE